MKKSVSLVVAFLVLAGSYALAAESAGPYFGTGVKIGEVTTTSAIIWTRLTSVPEQLKAGKDGVPLEKVTVQPPATKTATQQASAKEGFDPAAAITRTQTGAYRVPPGVSVDKVESAVPGAAGDVRLIYWLKSSPNQTREAQWAAVASDHDFTQKFSLADLQPGNEYAYRVEGRASGGGAVSATIEGAFRTAPKADEPARVVFTVVTGQNNSTQDDPKGHKFYSVMLSLQPSFFVHTGDIVYYDAGYPLVTSVELARYRWQQIYGLPRQIEFHRLVPTYFERDDHDTWQDDCWPTLQNSKMGSFTYAQGRQVFLDEAPVNEDTPFRTMRWGKDLQIWLPEGRDFRSPNDMPDGPDKTIWGAKQKEWFKKTVQESDATFRVLINETPLVGPDRKTKADNHANAAFHTEGSELRRFIASQKNMYIVNGDRHWQYVSVDPETGVREYSCGPTTDKHAGGFNQFVPEYHKYFKVCGGFLSGTVERKEGKPTLTFRHYAVDGKINHEETLTAE